MKDLVGKFLLLTLSVLILIIAPIQAFSQEKSSENNIADLQFAIENVLKETNTPAAGIAIVSKKGPVWITGLGKANIENDIEADENTLFRIASISKMFVALSILKLQEQGP